MSESNAQVKHGPVTAVTSATETSEVERARSLLAAELCGLGDTMTSAMAADPGFVPCGHAFGELIEGLYGATASQDADELAALAERARLRSEHVADHRGVRQGTAVFPAPGVAQVALLFAAVRGVGVDAWRALNVGVTDDVVDVFLANALSALGLGEASQELLVQAGRAAYVAGQLAR